MSRPRRVGARRYPSGQLVRDERALHARRLDYRYMRELAVVGVDREEAGNARAGSVLGRLRLAKLISEVQFWVGDEFGGIARRHAAIIGYNVGLIAGPRDSKSLPDPDPDVVEQIKNKFKKCVDTLMRPPALVADQVPIRPWADTYRVCVLDRAPESLERLKYGLSLLQKVLDK